jgi:hypothetical protein
MYVLKLDTQFNAYTIDGATWQKKTRAAPNRGLTDTAADGDVPAVLAAQKAAILELMLGQIANYCPVISRNTIVKSSTCLGDIWQAVRLHFGFEATGAHILDFADIRLEPDERPEDLFQRLVAFVEDNLLQQGTAIRHHGVAIAEDEEISPSFENFIVLSWLRLVHNDLPRLVKQRYGTELRTRTLASLRPEISQALSTLLSEIRSSLDAKVMRTSTSPYRKRDTPSWQKRDTNRQWSKPRTRQNRWDKATKSCPICKSTERDSTHFLSECKYLPESDRKFMLRARRLATVLDDTDDESEEEAREDDKEDQAVAYTVQVSQSPYLDLFHGHDTLRITIDSGATGNMIRASAATRLGVKIMPSSQSARQADGSSTLDILGETQLILTRDNNRFVFDGLVVQNLDVDVLGGTPFMDRNDIGVRPAKRQILLGDVPTYTYGSGAEKPVHHTVRRAHVLRAPAEITTVWPGEFIEIEVPPEFARDDSTFAVEPRIDAPVMACLPSSYPWPQPGLVTSVARKIRIPNLTSEPKVLKRNEQFCQLQPVFSPTNKSPPSQPVLARGQTKPSSHADAVCVDPDNTLTTDMLAKFRSLLAEYEDVFDPDFKGYNGSAGPFKANVNMGPVQPPQRKGRVPQYSRDKLEELQEKFDHLEAQGVFKRPEDAGVRVEYVNPSFLVKKSSGGYRLVTAFADVGRYSKPQPALMPDVDSTLRQIAQWQHIVVTDLSSAFYQIPLDRASMKYCGVATPFKGVRVYVRSAMGMPGSETALEELMCRVLGDLLQEGIVTKLADDLYCGGNSTEELLYNWKRVLHALRSAGLCLSAAKTIVAPVATTILGWRWRTGSISASPHRVSTLASCSAPSTVKAMRSFVGAYKVLARVLPGCAAHLAPLDDATAGLQSQDKIVWSPELKTAFTKAQSALASHRTIVLPRADDELWIITDGAVRDHGIGATMYARRGGKLRLAGFFSAKLQKRQAGWIPCEIEALSIAAALKHFSPYMIQSHHHTCILTDSKPCVQAFEKVCRGEFSASPRVTTFLSSVCRYQASIRHIAGVANLPSDHASRNAPTCQDLNCQVCVFVKQIEESVVLRTATEEVLNGRSSLPFMSRTTWLSVQSECPDLRRTRAHLIQGTRPSKKLTNIRDVKRYLNIATIARDSLLVVRYTEPLGSTKERIIIPRQVLDGPLTSLHIQLDHPTSYQFKAVTRRHLYALDMDRAIDRISSTCHVCASLKGTTRQRIEQSTCDPPDGVGISFAADIMKRARQLVLVVRECVTSYTVTCLIPSERHEDLRDALVSLCVELRPLDGPAAVIRTDPAPGFRALVEDEILHKQHIHIEVGRVKNVNKNPVADKAIQELEHEILRQHPRNDKLSPRDLAVITARLNARLRTRGLSAREMWFQRDQFTNAQLPLSDDKLISDQHDQRVSNHEYSAKCKAPTSRYATKTPVAVGDLVYLHTDGSKTQARNRYLVSSVEGDLCCIRKFVGTQVRNTAYRVKRSECYKVPADPGLGPPYTKDSGGESAEEDMPVINAGQQPVPPPPSPPPVPQEIVPQEIVPPAVETLEECAIGNPPTQEAHLLLGEEGLSSTVTPPPGPAQAPPLQPEPRRHTRNRRKPKWFDDYVQL